MAKKYYVEETVMNECLETLDQAISVIENLVNDEDLDLVQLLKDRKKFNKFPVKQI